MKPSLLMLALIPSFVNAGWSTSIESNPVDDIDSHYAISEWSQPIKALAFPYDKAKASIGIGCNTNGSLWAYVSHTKANFTNGQRVKDYFTYALPMKFGDSTATTIGFTSTPGSSSLKVNSANRKKFIDMIQAHDFAIIQESWHRNPQVFFKFDLTGSKGAIDSILNSCGLANQSVDPCETAKTKLVEYGGDAVGVYKIKSEIYYLLNRGKVTKKQFEELKTLNSQCQATL